MKCVIRTLSRILRFIQINILTVSLLFWWPAVPSMASSDDMEVIDTIVAWATVASSGVSLGLCRKPEAAPVSSILSFYVFNIASLAYAGAELIINTDNKKANQAIEAKMKEGTSGSAEANAEAFATCAELAKDNGEKVDKKHTYKRAAGYGMLAGAALAAFEWIRESGALEDYTKAAVISCSENAAKYYRKDNTYKRSGFYKANYSNGNMAKSSPECINYLTDNMEGTDIGFKDRKRWPTKSCVEKKSVGDVFKKSRCADGIGWGRMVCSEVGQKLYDDSMEVCNNMSGNWGRGKSLKKESKDDLKKGDIGVVIGDKQEDIDKKCTDELTDLSDKALVTTLDSEDAKVKGEVDDVEVVLEESTRQAKDDKKIDPKSDAGDEDAIYAGKEHANGFLARFLTRGTFQYSPKNRTILYGLLGALFLYNSNQNKETVQQYEDDYNYCKKMENIFRNGSTSVDTDHNITLNERIKSSIDKMLAYLFNSSVASNKKPASCFTIKNSKVVLDEGCSCKKNGGCAVVNVENIDDALKEQNRLPGSVATVKELNKMKDYLANGEREKADKSAAKIFKLGAQVKLEFHAMRDLVNKMEREKGRKITSFDEEQSKFLSMVRSKAKEDIKNGNRYGFLGFTKPNRALKKKGADSTVSAAFIGKKAAENYPKSSGMKSVYEPLKLLAAGSIKIKKGSIEGYNINLQDIGKAKTSIFTAISNRYKKKFKKGK